MVQGDPRTALTSFCETEGIELLVISSRSAGRLRKTFSGGSVSGYLIDKAPCPCLVAPLKALGISAGDEEEVALSPRGSSDGLESPLQGRPLSPKEIAAEVAPEMPDDVTTLAAKVALLQTQMEEKDRIIRDLRDELASLRLEQAQAKDALQHDPAAAPSTY